MSETKTKEGVVVSDKMTKTVTVELTRRIGVVFGQRQSGRNRAIAGSTIA